jgi:hypothetical protein
MPVALVSSSIDDLEDAEDVSMLVESEREASLRCSS